MRPWTRSQSRSVSDNPLYETLPENYQSEEDSLESKSTTSTSNPLDFDTESSTGTIPWASEATMAEDRQRQEAAAAAAAANLAANIAANNGINQAAPGQARSLRELLLPERNATPSCIIFPEDANNFHFRNGMIQLLPTFHGLSKDDPYHHLREFEDVCATFSDQNCTESTVRLKLFPFSLKDKAKTWFNSLRPRSIATWQELTALFLNKYYPLNLTTVSKRAIQNFTQKEDETYSQARERFKELLNACPHHGFEAWRLINFFYDGLLPATRQFVETMCNGGFYSKSAEQAEEYLEWLAERAQDWEPSPRENIARNKAIASGVYQVSETDRLNAEIAALNRKLEMLQTDKGNATF